MNINRYICEYLPVKYGKYEERDHQKKSMNSMTPFIPFVELNKGLNNGHKTKNQAVYLNQSPIPENKKVNANLIICNSMDIPICVLIFHSLYKQNYHLIGCSDSTSSVHKTLKSNTG